MTHMCLPIEVCVGPSLKVLYLSMMFVIRGRLLNITVHTRTASCFCLMLMRLVHMNSLTRWFRHSMLMLFYWRRMTFDSPEVPRSFVHITETREHLTSKI